MVLVLLTSLNCCMSTLRLVHYALLLTPACLKKSNNTNARHMAFAASLALDPTFGSHSHKTLDTAQPTLRALLSGTFLQTLPDLVTPLRGHSLSPRSCPPTRSAPSERFWYKYDCRRNLAPKHARKHQTHPPRVKTRVPSRFKRLWFYLC